MANHLLFVFISIVTMTISFCSKEAAINPQMASSDQSNNVNYSTKREQKTVDQSIRIVEVGCNRTAYQQITVGKKHVCALDNNKRTHCWNDVVHTNISDYCKTKEMNILDNDSILSIWSKRNVDCIININGLIRCIDRDNMYKQQLSIKLVNNEMPVELSLGTSFACARTSEGKVYCWGMNSAGQLGYSGSSTGKPREINGIIAKKIVSGDMHTCIITFKNRVLCWGQNEMGQLCNTSPMLEDSTTVFADGDMNSPIMEGETVEMKMISRPVEVEEMENVVDISAGIMHTCAITEGKNVICWGDNRYYQLGGIKTKTKCTVDVIPEMEMNKISSGDSHTCAINNKNEVLCWGRGYSKPNMIVIKVIDLNGDSYLVSDNKTTCVLERGKIKCWEAPSVQVECEQ